MKIILSLLCLFVIIPSVLALFNDDQTIIQNDDIIRKSINELNVWRGDLYYVPTRKISTDKTPVVEYKEARIIIKTNAIQTSKKLSDINDVSINSDQLRNDLIYLGAKNVEVLAFNREDKTKLQNIFRLDINKIYDPYLVVQFLKAKYLEIEYAQPDYVYRIHLFPNDPMFNLEWGLHNTGQTGGTLDADVDAPEAWNIDTGNSNVVVADIDTGVDYTHPDLVANMWTNPGEIPNDGLDNDNNGYIDDYYGWDFINNDNDPFDDNGHGTHTAGTIAAVTNNNLGIAGVCWSCKIMALKFLGAGGWGFSSDATNAVVYAADNGANITSNSWGGQGVDFLLEGAFNYAHSNSVLSIAAADNSGDNSRFVPAIYENVVGVSATDHNDIKAGFSTYGSWVDVAAPGKDVISTVPTGSCSLCDPTGYKSLSGTSMATPHVSGIAALIKSRIPYFSNNEIKNILRTTTDIPASNQYYIGVGRVNAEKALMINTTPIIDFNLSVDDLDAKGNVNIIGSVGGNNFNNYILEYGLGIYPASFNLISNGNLPIQNGLLGVFDSTIALDNSKVTFRLSAYNNQGSISRDMAVITSNNIEIKYPLPNDIFRAGDVLQINGSANASNFTNYIIEWGQGQIPSIWSAQGISLINNGQQSVIDSILGYWDTSVIIQKDFYTIKVSAYGSSAYPIQSEQVTVYLDPSLKQGFPVRVNYIPSPFGDPWTQNYVTPFVEDLNNDGKKEIYVRVNDKLYGFSDTGNLLSNWPVGLPSLYQMMHTEGALTSADIDLDGFKEILFPSRASSFPDIILNAYEYNGSLVSGWPKTYYPVFNSGIPGNFIEAPFSSIVVADVNNNGIPDIIYNNGDYLIIADNNGNLFTGNIIEIQNNHLNYCGLYNFGTPAVGNLDNDPDLEIIIVQPAPNCDSNNLTDMDGIVFALNIDGTSVSGWPIMTQWTPVGSPVIGDLDNDNDNEIVIVTTNGYPVASGIFVFDKTGNIMAGWPQLQSNFFSSTPALADIDGDADLEIIIGDSVTYQEFVFHHSGQIAAGWPRPITYDGETFSPIVLDVNSDQVNDIITSSGDWSTLFGRVFGWNYGGNALGDFPKITEERAGLVYVDDIDNDNKLEVVTTSNIDGYTTSTVPSYYITKGRASIYAWETPYNVSISQWPTFHFNNQRTGLYAANQSPSIPLCTTPLSNMIIGQNTIFCPGVYNVNYITVSGMSDIDIICNNTVLIGNNNGIHIVNSDQITVNNCYFKNYNHGIFLADASLTLIKNNVFESNQKGIREVLNNINISKNFVYENTFLNNLVGYDGGVQDSLVFNNFINNGQNIINNINSTFNLYGNVGPGNFWSGYNGTDSNYDGLGDSPYIITSFYADYAPLMNQHFLSLLSNPIIGQSFNLGINDPLDTNKQYFILASFGNFPVIILPDGRVIYLTNDGLLTFILQSFNTGLFQNTFGTLDSYGRAMAAISIPNIPALSGLTLYFAYIILDPSAPLGVGTISYTIPVTIV
ncbi:MAG: S8 family serine peptidase [Nanoarchaeota archaeon]